MTTKNENDSDNPLILGFDKCPFKDLDKDKLCSQWEDCILLDCPYGLGKEEEAKGTK